MSAFIAQFRHETAISPTTSRRGERKMNSVYRVSVFSVPLWLSSAPAKPRAISSISVPPGLKSSAISTVPLCSALFRQKFSLSYVVPPLGGPGQPPTPKRFQPTQKVPHAATHAMPSNECPIALPLLGERGAPVSNAQFPRQALQRPKFTFCPRLFTFVHDKKSFQKSRTPGNPDSPRPTLHRPRPVHT